MFSKGDPAAAEAGRKRMAALTPEERRVLARKGFAALCTKWGWSRRKTAAYLFDPLGYRGQGGAT